MVTVEVKKLMEPVGFVRTLQLIFTCITFSLVASVEYFPTSFWAWCMFTWCFCFCITFLILLLELLGLSAKLPISWNDFTTSFAMLATLMVLAVSIIYPVFNTCPGCKMQIGATVTSILAFFLYAIEVGLTRAKPGEISGFLSTVPGLLKVLETFVACIIFIFLGESLVYHPGLKWCIAVYSICFIFALLVIILTIFRLLALFPAPFNKVLAGCNVLAVLMYVTAVVIWPYYVFINYAGPYARDTLIVISFMTAFNLVVYIVDTVYSVKLVLSASSTQMVSNTLNISVVGHP